MIRRMVACLIVLLAAGGGIGLFRAWEKKSAPSVPAAEVIVGEFVDYVQLRGEIRARSSASVTAPFNAGDLQIIKLAANASFVKKGDVVVELDPTNLKRTVDQNRSSLKQTGAEADRLKAQQRILEEQNATDLMKARFDIERARLDCSKEEVVPAIEIEKGRLALAKAEQRLQEIEEKIASDRVAAEADLASAAQKGKKAQFDLEQAERNLASLVLRAPVDGIVSIMPNYRARTGFGGTTPPFKEGDRAFAGAIIAELPELASIQVNAPVEESDRGRLDLGQPVTMRIDAVPDHEHKGSVADISPLAKLDYSSWPIKKNFDLTVRLEQPDPRLRPGMSVTARIAVERLPNSILIPAEAVFEKNGRPLAYVLAQNTFAERRIQVTRRGEGHALIGHGLKPGERVALKDPTLETPR
jgi:RND family efflux transporter MFP subunit